MRTVPNLFTFWTASSFLIAFINCDSLILTVCYNNAKLYFSLYEKCNLQYVTTAWNCFKLKDYTIDYVKWEKKNLFFSDGGSTIWLVSTLLPKTFVCQQFTNMNPNTWNVKMRRIWWRSVCTGRFQQNPLNKFRYRYMQLAVSLIFPMDVNSLMDKLTDC